MLMQKNVINLGRIKSLLRRDIKRDVDNAALSYPWKTTLMEC